MRRYSLLAISLTGLATTAFLFWHLSPASAADDVKTIEIVKNADGKFVFSDPNAKITAGQSRQMGGEGCRRPASACARHRG